MCFQVVSELMEEVFIVSSVNENTIYRQTESILYSGSLVPWGLAKKSYIYMFQHKRCI